MATYTIGSDSETWDAIAEQLDIPRDALLRANFLDPEETWPSPSAGEEIALPHQPDDAAVAPENDHSLDVGGDPGPEPFDLPPQKDYLPDQPNDAPANDDAAGDGPILVAANDDKLVLALVEEARASDAKRNADSTVTRPGGNFIPVRVVASATRPDIRLDHGFLDDGAGNIDESKKRAPTVSDILSREKWATKLLAAKLARPDLGDATDAYDHFLDATGTDRIFSYDDYVDGDRAGACTLASALEDIRAGAIELQQKRATGDDAFTVQTGAIGVGKNPRNPRYPYPGTENWQKAIGAHVIWLEAAVNVDAHTVANRRKFVLSFTLHAEDRYNFNPGMKDIATGTPDAENGQFELCGLGKEFNHFSTLTREVRFSLPLASISDTRARLDDLIVLGPNDVARDAPGMDGGLPPGGT